MTPEIRSETVMALASQYYAIMRTTLFTLAAVAAIIELGPGGYSAPLTMLAIGATAYGILAGGVALDDLNNLRQDMDEATAQTAYGKGVSSRNIPVLKMISTVLLGLIGLAELYVIFT